MFRLATTCDSVCPAAGGPTPEPKLNLLDRAVCTHHRTGWAYAIDALTPLFAASGSGIVLDPMVDRRFGRLREDALQRGQLPYQRPWIGVIHCPPSIPGWACHEYAPAQYFESPTWREGLPHCRGLITLSTRMAHWLRGHLDVPVLAVKHPTPVASVRFDYNRFASNPNHRIIHVGWWLRRFASFHHLRVRSLRKALLLPFADEATRDRILPVIERDIQHHGAPPLREWNVEVLDYQSHDSYDRLLSENLVFLHLYDTVANNAILECIARHTPLLVNRLPDAEEYLGSDYPLFFGDLDEAARKAEDMTLIREAHQYLRELPKDDLTAEYFRNAITGSALYERL